MQHAVDMRANTFRAYYPKLQRIVPWLVCKAAHGSEHAAHDGDTLINDTKFLAFLNELQSGEDLQPVAGDGVILLGL